MWYIYTVQYYSATKRIKSCYLQQHGWSYSALYYYVRERQIRYDFTHVNLRNKIDEDREGGKKREANHQRLLTIEKKPED